jgi:two-component SAPR family response regulator
MNRPEKWKEMVNGSKESIENFNDFLDDKAIVWADNEMNNYRLAMLVMINSGVTWQDYLSEDGKKLVMTMLNRSREQNKAN